jgi:hypothetical protein
LDVHFGFGGLAGFLKVEEYGQVFVGAFYSLESVGPVLLLLDFLEDLLRPFGVVPKVGSMGQLLFLSDLLKSVIDVKDASSEHQPGRKVPSVALVS